MMRPRVQAALVELNRRYGAKLALRVSLDHWRADRHDEERGIGSFAETLEGLRWLRDHHLSIAIAGRSRWGDSDRDLRAGYGALCAREHLAIDADDQAALVIFPEMDARAQTQHFQDTAQLFVAMGGGWWDSPTIPWATGQPDAAMGAPPA